MEDHELSGYMSSAARRLVAAVLKRSLQNPREIMFLVRFGFSVRRSNSLRKKYESGGEHIPIFLISSITSSCNLFCRGCYARSNGISGKSTRVEMSLEDWKSLFAQAEQLGIPFNILAGGEPLIRKDIIQAASVRVHTVFPIFTNGTLIDDEYLIFFRKNRNMIPVLSLEGGRKITDDRRGPGIYDSVLGKMSDLGKNGIFYGVSVTLTYENIDDVTGEAFMHIMEENGCRILFFIEFVSSDDRMKDLLVTDAMRVVFNERLERLRSDHKNMIFMSFPGDEKNMGGCLGAGRGFFHISPYGDAEICPASPYSDVNLMNNSLREAISSELFRCIRNERLMMDHHAGGCALIGKEDIIEDMLSKRSL